jgi:pimeloyl-ACP methyl ester carboxylesterase
VALAVACDVVLIHSTGQSARGWERLIDALEALGARAHAIDLPNDRPELLARDYASLLADRFAHLDRPVVLAHSGSGPLLPQAATALGARRQVWLAAWVPHPSLSFFDDVRAHKEEAFAPDWVGRDPTADDEAALHFVYHDCDAETQAWALATRRPFFPEAVYAERVVLEPAIPSTYILAREDRTIRPDWQRRMALERLAVEPVELRGGHCPNVSRPRELADLLVRL